jgi:hypothetical protein
MFSMLVRKIRDELLIWCIFLFAIYICISYHLHILQLPNLFSLDSDLIEGINSIVVNLSYSFTAGIIFYFFSVILPEAQKSIIVFPNLLNELEIFLSEFSELSRKVWGDDWISSKTPEDVRTTVYYSICGEYPDSHDDSHNVNVNAEFVKNMLPFYNRTDSILEKIMIYEKYLTKSEYKKLEKLRSNFYENNQFRRDFNSYISPLSCQSKTLKLYINSLIYINNKVKEIHGSLNKIVHR